MIKVEAFVKKLVLFFIGLILTCFVFAADYYQMLTGEGALITEHGVCVGVTNNTGQTIFIPTKSDPEWTSFRSNPPANVIVTTCCAKAC